MTSRRWITSLALASVAFATPSFAQTPDTTAAPPPDPNAWKWSSTMSLNVSQSSFTSNWSGGDNGSLVWLFKTLTTAEKQFSPSFLLTNLLDVSFGMTADQADTPTGDLVWESPEKTTDVIRFESTGRWTLGGFADPYAALSVESQFMDESDPRGTIDFNPFRIKESAGLSKQLFKTDDSEGLARFGGAARQTMGQAFVDPLGLEKTDFVTNDYGLEFQVDVKKPFAGRKILYQGTLLVLQALGYTKADELQQVDDALRAVDPSRESIADFWKTTDVNWRNDFTAKITKNLGVTLAAQFVYDKYDVAALVDPALASSSDPAVQAAYAAQVDKNVRKAGQFREVFALQFSYRLF